MSKTFEGTPCRKCKGTERYIKCKQQCVACLKAYRDSTKASRVEYDKEYSLRNGDVIKARSKAAYHADPIGNMEKVKTWQRANSERVAAYKKSYKDSNPDKVNASTAKRRAAKLNRTPSWLCKEHFDEIQVFYKEAKARESDTGELYHVDHIIPLQGDIVSGLHVPWNLQVIPAKDNLMKNNKFEEATHG